MSNSTPSGSRPGDENRGIGFGPGSSRQKPPRVVAELGRPETPDETAARKAENSRKYRASKTINNLWLSLIVCVAVVVVIVLLVPRDNTSHLQTVDYRSVASSAQAAFPVPVASPDLPSTYGANAAEIRSSGTGSTEIPYWYVGFTTPTGAYLGLEQAVSPTAATNSGDTGAIDDWVAQQVHNTSAVDVTTIDGIQWTVYDNRQTANDVGNASYALTTTSGATTYVLLGTATTDEFDQVASAISTNIQVQPATAVITQ